MRKSMSGCGSGIGMLRSRRRDANVKPNRVLDRNSSRGMIYENEELRLRTININAEIERGQSDIKKLRRENDHLRRELWALREECDRLQELLKHREEEDEEEDDEDEEENCEESDELESQQEDPNKDKFEVDGLSVVPEETEDSASNTEHSPPPLPPPGVQNLERRIEEFKGTLPPCLRINSIHPFTAATNIDQELFPHLTVGEVIEEAVKSNIQLVGVRLLEGSIYLSAGDKNSLEALLAKGITLRTIQLTLHDVSAGTVVLSLSGVPHQLSDKDLTHVLSQFGPVIGVIERRLYRSIDTGERVVRIRPAGSLPKKLYVQGSEISLRPIPHQELARMSIQQIVPKPTLHIRIRNGSTDPMKDAADTSATNTTTNSEEQPVNAASSSSATANVAVETTIGRTQPPTPSSASSHSIPKLEERCQSAPAGTQGTGPSPGLVRRGLSDSEVKKSKRTTRRGPSPSSSSEQEVMPALTRSIRSRRTSGLPKRPTEEEARERSVSLSSRGSLRRKMSMTGRETGKLPWCACWGNGCL
ncbi:uncharacterized protein isoform X2 [Rhodnius prolixus]|uniref:RRM domain-containing protein n=1 Tax=Rhodnius prolixus TaxID=13249 RepID=A0A905R0G1_RHOPR